VLFKLPMFYSNIDCVCWLQLRVICDPFSLFTKWASFLCSVILLFGYFKSAHCLLATLFSCMHCWSSEQGLSITGVNSKAERIEQTLSVSGVNRRTEKIEMMHINICVQCWFMILCNVLYFCYYLPSETELTLCGMPLRICEGRGLDFHVTYRWHTAAGLKTFIICSHEEKRKYFQDWACTICVIFSDLCPYVFLFFDFT
jgi:hypothetical protein